MLSRHAESFFWLSRNVERAETVARVLDVTYTRSMDLHAGGTWEQRSWRAALAITAASLEKFQQVPISLVHRTLAEP